MSFYVVGGAGFLGRRLVRRLAETGEKVICLDINPVTAPFEDLGSRVVVERLDLTQFEQVISSMLAHKPRVAINLSYLLGQPAPRAAMNVNVLGMDNFFEAARLATVERVLFASAVAVYGKQVDHGDRWLTEKDPVKPDRQYGYHKVFNEWQAKEYRARYGMNITGLRVGNVAAPDKLLGSVDHVECIARPAMGLPVTVKYRDQRRCVIHIDDIADVFYRMAISEQHPKHRIYNSGGESVSHGDIADMVRRIIPDALITFENETGGEELSGANRINNEWVKSEFGVSYPPYEQRVAEIIESVQRAMRAG